LGGTVDFSDVVPASNFAGLPIYKTPREAATLERILIQGIDICAINIDRLHAAQTRQSGERESNELARQLRRIIHFLMTGEDPSHDKPLALWGVLHEGTGGEAGSDVEFDGRALVLDLDQVVYHDAGRTYRRHSPMVTRLALLCCERDVRLDAGVRR
jgi:hypothetical protein